MVLFNLELASVLFLFKAIRLILKSKIMLVLFYREMFTMAPVISDKFYLPKKAFI